MRILLVLILLQVLVPAAAATRPVWRLDFIHSGGSGKDESIQIEGLYQEPGQWTSTWSDTLNRGDYRVELIAVGESAPWFSQSYSSVYSDWARSAQQKDKQASFEESIRFPAPLQTSQLMLYARQLDKDGQPFKLIWQIRVDADHQPELATPVASYRVRDLQLKGPARQKLDLLFMAEGFTGRELEKFFAAAEQAMAALFSTEPFASLQDGFNVRALFLPSKEAGLGGDTALKVNPNALGMPRYALTLETFKLRNAAMQVPYDNIVILTNSEQYSASGIYGAYAVVPAFQPRLRFLLVHELGHHLAGLADEYFHGASGYATGEDAVEPHEPNVTALKDLTKLKWAAWVDADTPVPTPWAQSHFIEDPHSTDRWLDQSPYAEVVGAYQGANYSPTHYYRPALNCLMFRDGGDNGFCPVCAHAIREVVMAAGNPERADKPPRPAAHAAAMR